MTAHLGRRDELDRSAEFEQRRVADAFTFEALKYHDGGKLESYKAVCVARNLLQDDAEWSSMLDDAQAVLMPDRIRALFVYVIYHNEPENPMALFEAHVNGMGDDFRHRMHWEIGSPLLRARVLLDIEERVQRLGSTLRACGIVFTDAERASGNAAMHATARRDRT